jgi:hypothetical protein
MDLLVASFRIAHGVNQGKSVFPGSERNGIFSLTYKEKNSINCIDSIRGGSG